MVGWWEREREEKLIFPARSYFSLSNACLLRILKALRTFLFMSWSSHYKHTFIFCIFPCHLIILCHNKFDFTSLWMNWKLLLVDGCCIKFVIGVLSLMFRYFFLVFWCLQKLNDNIREMLLELILLTSKNQESIHRK